MVKIVKVTAIIAIDEHATQTWARNVFAMDSLETSVAIADVLEDFGRSTNKPGVFHVASIDCEDITELVHNQINSKDSLTTESK